MRPIFLFELNEVPKRILHLYASDSRFPNIKKFLTTCMESETITTDTGELSPWVTWPTIHRGMNNENHGIANLGQDPSTFKGVPIWQEFKNRGFSIGVFGSLQSWPPIPPGEGGFYIPDTFAQDASCYPAELTPVLEFNLQMVKENTRVMGRSPVKKIFNPGLAIALLRAGIKPATLAKAALHLVAEKFDPRLKERRATFQAMIFWDIFSHIFNSKSPPAFTSFFTNNVASVMHRFWNNIFPEDFSPNSKYKENDRYHKSTMDFAMSFIDKIFAQILEWQQQNPNLIVIIASSMGQAAIERAPAEFEFLLRDVDKLMKKLFVDVEYRVNLAMSPQTAIVVENNDKKNKIIIALESMRTESGKQLFEVKTSGTSISISTRTLDAPDFPSGIVIFRDQKFSLEDLGLALMKTHPGTAYHIPEGIFLLRDLKRAIQPIPNQLRADEVKEKIMDWSGIRA